MPNHRLQPIKPAVVAVAMVLGVAHVAVAQDAPTMLELQMLEAQGDWGALVQGTARALQLKESVAHDRVELFRMKAEGHLRLKQFSIAADTLERAARDKSVGEATADQYLALAMLYRASNSGSYKPPATKETPQPPTYDILLPAERNEALKVLCDVRLGELAQDVTSLGDRSQGDDFSSAIQLALQVRPLERTVLGASPQSDAALGDVQMRFVRRVSNWIVAREAHLDQIAARANELFTTDRGQQVRRGLQGQDQVALGVIIDGCQKWVGTHRQLVGVLGDRAVEPLVVLRPQLLALERRAQAVLTDQYGKVSPEVPDDR